MKILFFTTLFIFIIFIVNFIDEKYNNQKRLMKDLTGKYTHSKTPNGLVIKVQYKNDKNELNYRVATETELEILKKYKYL